MAVPGGHREVTRQDARFAARDPDLRVDPVETDLGMGAGHEDTRHVVPRGIGVRPEDDVHRGRPARHVLPFPVRLRPQRVLQPYEILQGQLRTVRRALPG